MIHSKFQGQWPLGSGEYSFYHICAGRPLRLCDQDQLNKISFTCHRKAPDVIYGFIWLTSCRGKRMYESVVDGRQNTSDLEQSKL